MVTRIGDLDIVFISYDEPDADAHFDDLKAKAPWAQRVHGVKGLTTSFKHAAALARTERFITVDADSLMAPAFLEHHVSDDKLNSSRVLSWPTRNVVNGLAYGHGGLKCWSRSVLAACAEPDDVHFDHTVTFDFVAEPRCFGTTHPNGTARHAFRGAFREGVRLSLVGGEAPGLGALNQALPPNNLRRLLAWCSIGADAANGLWCLLGARDGCLRAQNGTLDRLLIADYDHFDAFFEREIEPSTTDLAARVAAHGEALRKGGLEVCDLSPGASAWFRDIVEIDVNPAAFDMLGNLYEHGADFPSHPDKAFDAFMTGALLGNGNAMNNVARCLRNGYGTPPDPVQAENWLRCAAASDNPYALLRLGQRHLDEGDQILARYWLTRALAMGAEEARTALEKLPQGER